MNSFLPSIYLSILTIVLTIIVSFLVKQIIQKRDTETEFSILQRKLKRQEMNYEDYYSLGIIYLSKKLFDQSIIQFSYALKNWNPSDIEGLATLYNTIGFTYSETNQLDFAIYYYKKAISTIPNYTIALNNLAYAYEKKKMISQAIEVYKLVLQYNKENTIATEKLISLSKRYKTSG